MAGAIFDRFIFRPLIGWATAWSFDRLRLWIERGILPETSLRNSIIHAIARIAVAFIWIYHGLVPKLLFMHDSGEMETIAATGLANGWEERGLVIAGICEMLFGLAMLVLWRGHALFLLNILIMIGLAITIALAKPELYIHEFNPASLNVLVIGMAIIGWMASKELPSASRCLREPREPEP